MPRYDAYPQYPDTQVTPFNPEQVSLIKLAEAIIIGAHSRDVAMRDTCREFIGGYDVPRAKPKPPGDVHYCTSCHDWKHRRDFSPDARKVNGLKSHCKKCCSDEQKRLRLRQAALYRNTA